MDPVDVFNAMLAAFNRGDWLDAASYFDATSLEEFKRRHVESARRDAQRRTLTADDFMENRTDLPPEVAEYYATQLNRSRASGNRLHAEFPGIADVHVLEHLNPIELFGAWLRGRSARSQMAQMMAAENIPAEQAESALATVTEPGYTAFGYVLEKDQLAHIVYRELNPEDSADEAASDEQQIPDVTEPEQPRLITCRKQSDESWKLIINERFPGDWMAFGICFEDEADEGS